MIFVRFIGGLGNQLFQYTIGKQISINTGAPLKLDLSVYNNPDARSYMLHYYNITEKIATEKEVENFLKVYESKSLYAKLYRRAEKYIPKHKRRYFVEDENEYYLYKPGLLKASSNVLLEGFWQHHKYFKNISSQVLDQLTLKAEYIPPAFNLFTQIEQNRSSVSLHIRRGDYISDPNNLNYFGVLPIEYYNKAIDYINSKIKNPVYYVFSDDLDWAKDNLLKQNTPKVFVDIEGGKKDYLELEAMRRCHHNIIANSSFSWWGAFLNKNPNKIVIAPAKWLAMDEINRNIEIQFPSWKKI